MRKFISTLCATVLAASVGMMGALPAIAAPVNVLQVQPLGVSDVIQVDNDWKKKHRNDHVKKGFYKHNNQGWYNGHPGYKHKRPGYRYHNGWWFPAGAFITGVIIGGAINDNVYHGGSAHIQWCHSHYRSYRSWDNSWQPYNGPRRQCISPYM